MDFTWFDCIAIIVTACACSWVNAIAGGGILLLYPLLTFLGIPPLVANVSIKIGLYPGSIGAMVAERQLIKEQWRAVRASILPAFFGALVGSAVVVYAGEKSFAFIVPWCIIGASVFMAFSRPIKAFLSRTFQKFREKSDHPLLLALATVVASFYSGYFGAGHGFIYYSLLSMFYNRDIRSINALRQITITANHTASFLFFALTIYVDWEVAGLIFIGSIIGGYLGGVTSKHIPSKVLKNIVLIIGFLFGLYILLKTYGLIPAL